MGLSLTIRQTMNFIILAFLLFSPLFLVETLAGSNCRCGEEGGSGPADYIINNDDDNVVKPNQYPWVVQLFITKVVDGKRGTFICGGTLVASKYIISAAHCMVGDQGKVRESDIQVTLGEHNLRKRNEGPLAELDLQVQKLVVHPDYNNLGSGNDISLLYLAQEGDSGGPLTYKFHDQHILIGDTSWGTLEGCGRAGKYGVYGRISYFRPWFEKEMNKLEAPSYCSSGSEAGY